MTVLKSQTISLRMSEIREALNAQAEDAPVEDREKLLAEYTDAERRYRAELTVEGLADSSPEHPERRELRERASIADVTLAALERREATGATRELQESQNLGSNQVPLELLETRASTHTPAPTDGEPTAQTFVPAVFPMGLAAYLGVAQPTVGAGISSYHVLSTNLTVNTPDAGADGANSAGAFSSSLLEPRRVQGAFVIRREDVARLGPGLESSLRENLSMALSSKLDAELVTGAGGLAGTGGLANPTDPTADVDYAGYVALASSMVDGLYADTVASVRLLFSSRLYKHALATYRAGTTSAPATGETSALERLMQLTGGVRATSQISDSPTSGTGADIETVIGARATGLIHMVQPIWSGPTMIVDDVTRADEGELVITLVGLFAQKIVRAAGFSRQEIKLG